MFGFRKRRRSTQGGALGMTNLRRAALAGAGMLALRWWRNRQASNRGWNPGQPSTSANTGESSWSRPTV
jgi:hypothetical protein